MKLPNRKHQKTTIKAIRDNEFIPNVGLGVFDFCMREKDLLNILGSNTKYHKSKKDNTVVYDTIYNGEKILFFFHYNGRGFDYLSIHLSNLRLLETDIFNKNSHEVICIAKAFHLKMGIKFKYVFEEMESEAFIDFENIGLSVWVESDIVSDISICK